MKKITHNTKNIEITSTGIDLFTNVIRYTITTSLNDLEYCITLFNKQFTYVDGSFILNEFAYVNNLSEIITNNLIEPSDVGLNGYQISQNFGISIIYMTNTLGLDLNEWTLQI